MYKIDDFSTPYVALIVVIGIFAVFFIISVLIVKVKFPLIDNYTQKTIAGNKMACGETISCQAGQVCTSTEVGNICLAELGSECSNLQQCIPNATACTGRCTVLGGTVGSVCSDFIGCLPGLTCTKDQDNVKRCLYQQGASGCTSFYDCVPGSVCFNGTCEAGIEPFGICENSSQCAGYNQCLLGHCQPADVSIAGAIGSYCNVPSDCIAPLECQYSDIYDLPQNIGYCTKPIAKLGDVCTRYIGCVPVSECINGQCNFNPTDINACASNVCSGGLTCVSGECVSNINQFCAANSECLSSGCTQNSLNMLSVNGTNSIYDWTNLYANTGQFTDLSIIETLSGSTILKTFCLHILGSNTFYIYSSAISAYNINFIVPSGITVSNITTLKIAQPNIITVQITITNGASIYDKVFLRPLSDFTAPSLDWILDEDDCALIQNVSTIEFYNYDFVGSTFYLINNDYTTVTSYNPYTNVVIQIRSDLDQACYVVHYTSSFASNYIESSIFICSRKNGVYHLYNNNLFTGPAVDIALPDTPKNFGLIFTLNNTPQNFNFLYYSTTSLYYGSFNAIGSSVSPVQIRFPQKYTNIIQDMVDNSVFYLNGSSCN